MRLLFVGDAAATGFGTVTADLGRALLDLGEDVRFLSQNTANFVIPEPLGSRTFRLNDDARPEHVLAALTGEGMPDKWKPEGIIILGDYFAARWIVVDQRVREALQAVPSYHYVPVEGVGLPPAWKGLWDIVSPVAMTKFGADQIEEVMGRRPPMVYHGVDQSVFYPVAANRPAAVEGKRITSKLYPVAANRPAAVEGKRITSKLTAKEHFGIDTKRVMLLRTDRHMPRKRYNAMLRALLPVFERNPEADLVIHCRPHDQGGLLYDSLSKYPIWFRERVFLTNAHNTFQGLSREELNVLYNAADIYVQNSAEGFGLTVAEAIACGVPAVGINYSAVPEVIGPAGLTASVAHLIDNEYDHHWAAEDPDEWGQHVERLIRKPAFRRSLGAAGPRHVAANFSWARAAEQFRDIVSSRLEVAA